PLHGVVVALLSDGLRTDRSRPGRQHLLPEHVGGARPAPLDHLDRAADRLRRQDMPPGQELDELLEQVGDELRLPRLARDRDLVAPDEDVGLESLLDQLEQLVAGPEQRHHVALARDEDLDGRRRPSPHPRPALVCTHVAPSPKWSIADHDVRRGSDSPQSTARSKVARTPLVVAWSMRTSASFPTSAAASASPVGASNETRTKSTV